MESSGVNKSVSCFSERVLSTLLVVIELTIFYILMVTIGPLILILIGVSALTKIFSAPKLR